MSWIISIKYAQVFLYEAQSSESGSIRKMANFLFLHSS